MSAKTARVICTGRFHCTLFLYKASAAARMPSFSTTCVKRTGFSRRPATVSYTHLQQEFIQINTKNILFICGGAFDGLEKHIQKRTDTSALGFGGKLKEDPEKAKQNLLRLVEPHDLVRFGLIPELVGRIPVVTVLDLSLIHICKTATINFYTVGGVYLVDLPGYGYAKVAQGERQRWDKLINSYFERGRRCALLVQLLDSRHARCV